MFDWRQYKKNYNHRTLFRLFDPTICIDNTQSSRSSMLIRQSIYCPRPSRAFIHGLSILAYCIKFSITMNQGEVCWGETWFTKYRKRQPLSYRQKQLKTMTVSLQNPLIAFFYRSALLHCRSTLAWRIWCTWVNLEDANIWTIAGSIYMKDHVARRLIYIYIYIAYICCTHCIQSYAKPLFIQ